jgi:hypothetical protein
MKMYDAIAIAFIAAMAGLFWFAIKWATRGRRLGPAGMLRITIGIFAVVFVETLVQIISDPSPKGSLGLSLQWGALITSVLVVAVSGIRLARIR